MKISLALANPGPISRQTAWGCLASNLALPGSGSLAAGKRSGYFQLALAFIGLGVSTVTITRLFSWYISHFSSLQDPDPGQLTQLFQAMRGPLLGLAIFALGLIWSLLSSLQILRSARADPKNIPPRL
jgi:hypothetical protein